LALAGFAVTCQPPAPRFVVTVDASQPGTHLPRALLGHYDLSGELLAYDQVPGLPAAMSQAGFVGSDWRIGLGRWEAATHLLPTLSDGTPCGIPTPAAAAPAGSTDLDLITSRDWFSDDGNPVTLADTTDDARYSLAYVRAAADVASAFGATPYLSVDSMPRALAVNRAPLRDDCLWSFKNQVSNVRPADDAVFSAALVGAVDRLVGGESGEPGRPITHIEIWNEPELPFFWDPAFEDLAGPLDRFFNMAITSLVALDSLRNTSSDPNIQALSLGLAGFANATIPELVISSFDAATLPGGGTIPIDFLSFHAYDDDPLVIVERIESVASAVAATTNYPSVELVLGEWGPDLQTTGGDPVYAASMAPALHVATVLSLGANAGLGRAHHAILYDFYPGIIQLGIIDGAVQPKPAHRAYELLAEVITGGSVRLDPDGSPDGKISQELSVISSRDAAGTVRMLFTNRGPARLIGAHLGDNVGPSELRSFFDPALGITTAPGTGPYFTIPGNSLVLATF
jgi:hypothetical protein